MQLPQRTMPTLTQTPATGTRDWYGGFRGWCHGERLLCRPTMKPDPQPAKSEVITAILMLGAAHRITIRGDSGHRVGL